MPFGLDYGLLVNVGGALLFLVVGVAILVMAWGSRRGRLVGAVAATFGATYIFQNLTVAAGNVSPAGTALLVACALPATVLTAWLVADLARGTSARSRSWLIAVVAASAVTCALVATLSFHPSVRSFSLPPGMPGAIGGVVMYAQQFALIPLLAAIGLAFRAAGNSPRQAEALACLAMAFGPFTVFLFIAGYIAVPDVGGNLWANVYNVSGIATGALATLAAIPFVRLDAKDGLQRAVYPVLLATGMFGVGVTLVDVGDVQTYWGAYGIIRSIGAAFLALGVLAFDLLEVPLPHLVVKRGVVATGALASLFVVAQVMQNFLSAEYGLLTGGIIAGTVLFAANPVQKAIERATERRDGPRATAAPDGDVRQRREDVYLSALRLAMRDRSLTREEEVHLHHLAEELGIGAGRAHEMMVAVEGERPTKRRRT